MVHAALLLLMLEAVNADLVFTISLKRSTHYSQLSTSCWPITPSFAKSRTFPFVVMIRLGLARSGHPRDAIGAVDGRARRSCLTRSGVAAQKSGFSATGM